MPARLTRRGALAATAVAAASCAGGDPAPRSVAGPGSGAGLLKSVLAFEHAVVAAYLTSAEVLRGRALTGARIIVEQEREHVRRLSRLIESLGATPPRPRERYEYERSFPRLRRSTDALRFAEDLEQRLVRAYLEALRELRDPRLRREVAAIATTEAEHLAVVQGLRGHPLPPRAFVTGT